MISLGALALAGVFYWYFTRPPALGPPPVEQWTQHIGADMCRAAVFPGPGGSLYVVHRSEYPVPNDGEYHNPWRAFACKFSADGKLAWSDALETGDVDTASIGHDGCIYIPPGDFSVSGGAYNQITRVDPDGTLSLAAQTESEVQCSDFFVDRFGSFFMQTWEYPDHYVCKLDRSGKFEFRVKEAYCSDPRGWDGEAMASDGSGGILCFKTDRFISADVDYPRMSSITRFDGKGRKIWRVGDFTHKDAPDRFCADSSGNFYVVGTAEYREPGHSGANWFSQLFYKIRTWPARRRFLKSGGRDPYVEKYNANGRRVWSRELTTPVEDEAAIITADPAGCLYVAIVANAGRNESYTLNKYSPHGRLLWTLPLGRPGWRPVKLLADGKGHIYVIRSAGYEEYYGKDVAIVEYAER